MKNIKNVMLLAFCLSLTMPTVYAGWESSFTNAADSAESAGESAGSSAESAGESAGSSAESAGESAGSTSTDENDINTVADDTA